MKFQSGKIDGQKIGEGIKKVQNKFSDTGRFNPLVLTFLCIKVDHFY